MREPRPKQVFPTGGKNLYELLRSDHEPVFVDVFPENECERGRADDADTLTYNGNFDPMLYFWPVEGQHVVAHFNGRPADLERLVRAMQRDGVAWLTVIYKKDKQFIPLRDPNWTKADGFDVYAYEHWGDSDGFMQRRYGPAAMDTVAIPGRGCGEDRQGAGDGAPNSGGLTDRQRQDDHGDGTVVAGA